MTQGATGLRPIAASTEHLPERERFAYWNEVICRTVVDLDCRPIEQPGFAASIGGFDAPGLGVYDIRTHAHLVYRERPQIARLDGDALIINYVSAGQLHTAQGGQAVDLAVGDGAVCDAARPYFLRFDRPLGCVSVKVYKDELAPRVRGIERIAALSLRQHSSLTPLVTGYLHRLIDTAPTLSPAAGLEAVAVFKDLLAASLNEAVSGSAEPAADSRAVALLRAKAHIDAHLGDPALGPAQVARALGLSVRYLNLLFEQEQTSLMRHVLARRLERCARMLGAPAHAARPITDIAFEAGFNDASHFSRSFKARFGMAPRDYRARSSPAPDATTRLRTST